jgi:hypothetical protein
MTACSFGQREDLVDWLEQARPSEPAATARARELGSDALDEVARRARGFRRWLRDRPRRGAE